MATILIVDDDAALREGLAETAGRPRPRRRSAASGPEALAAARGRRRSTPCCSTCACRAMDGLEVLRDPRAAAPRRRWRC